MKIVSSGNFTFKATERSSHTKLQYSCPRFVRSRWKKFNIGHLFVGNFTPLPALLIQTWFGFFYVEHVARVALNGPL